MNREPRATTSCQRPENADLETQMAGKRAPVSPLKRRENGRSQKKRPQTRRTLIAPICQHPQARIIAANPLIVNGGQTVESSEAFDILGTPLYN